MSDDPLRFPRRAELVALRIDELTEEARGIERGPASFDAISRLEALNDEMRCLLSSMREIRREQLEAQLLPPSRRRRPWWQRWHRPP